MGEIGLVLVGLEQDAPLLEQYERLWQSGAFDRLITLSEIPADTQSYWTAIVRQLPESLATALVIPSEIDVTDDMLRLGALLEERVSAVFPMAVAHEMARPLMKFNETLNLSAADINVWLNRYALGRAVELPTLAGYCGWIKVAALRDVADDAINDLQLAHRLRERGQSLLLSDEAFVDDARLPRVTIASDNLPDSLERALAERHPFTAIRHPLSELNAQQKHPPSELARGPMAILHISHSWGGGLGRWVSDFCEADKNNLHIVLKSIGTRQASAQALALYLGDMPVPLKQWSLTTPLQSTSLGSWEYRQILREIRASFSVRAVVVSSLIGHSMDIYEESWPIVQVLHDYYPWCPPLYATWGDPCSECDKERLGRCLASNPAHQFFGEESIGWFATVREQLASTLCERNIPVIAPSQCVKKRWQQLAPSFGEIDIRVIGHGLPESQLKAFSEHRWQIDPDTKLHIVVLGVLPEHKGSRLLLDVLPDLLLTCRVTLLGVGENAPSFHSHPNLEVIKWFQLPDLPRLLQELQPEVGLLLSTVPETFSYTLSELFAAGIPPVATNLGAFADRIRDGHNGWLVPPDSESVKERISWLQAHREELIRVRRALLSAPPASTEQTTKQYLALLPEPDLTSYCRPLCRSVLTDLGVHLDQAEPSGRALFVRPGVAFRPALFQFLMYSHQKALESPKLSRVSKRLLALCIRVALKLAKP